jgi:Putative zinc-finger
MTHPGWDCAETRVSLGVYVLGAIDPAERSLVDAHLATCRDCRDELAGLAGIPALLARVGPEEISRIMAEEARPDEHEAPPELVATVLDLAAARRRRTRWRYAAAAAAVVAIVGGLFGGLAASGSPSSSGHEAAFPLGPGKWQTVTGTADNYSATVAYADEDWGVALEAQVENIPIGTTCQLWAYQNGGWVQVSAWTTGVDEGRVWYPGSLPKTGSVTRFKVTAGSQNLVSISGIS